MHQVAHPCGPAVILLSASAGYAETSCRFDSRARAAACRRGYAADRSCFDDARRRVHRFVPKKRALLTARTTDASAVALALPPGKNEPLTVQQVEKPVPGPGERACFRPRATFFALTTSRFAHFPGEVLINVKYATMNRRDVFITQGLYPGWKKV